MNNLAGLYKRQAKYDQAEPLYVKCLQLREKTLGRQHPSTLTSINNLAGLHECKGEYEVAEPLYVECCEASEKLLGRQHPFTLTSINNLAGLYESQGKHQTKLLYQEYLKAEEKILE
ncbi:kinesin light chain [Chytriomyces sp. MP71]|nr:kinesin light chain [Chytriomyces sp. MP71]